MIDVVRTYLKNMIANVDSNLKENDSAFYNGDIAETKIEEKYQIQINDLATISNVGDFEDSLTAIISIFGYGYRAQTSNYDCLFDKAICIRNECVRKENIFPAEYIYNAESSGINATTLETDETGYRFDINLTLTLGYSEE